MSLASAVTPTAIHDARIAARKLHVLLHAYRGEFDLRAGKRYRRHLKRLARDLAAAREADVNRRIIAQLAAGRGGDIGILAHAAYEHAARTRKFAFYALRLTIAAGPWQRRLADLRALSASPSLVIEDEEGAAAAMSRLNERCRRRLREALHRGNKNPRKLHRVRLKVKAARYLLEDSLPKPEWTRSAELKRLRQLQDCLGDLHDEEKLIEALRADASRRDTARELGAGLEQRRSRYLRAFKKHREALLRLWERAA